MMDQFLREGEFRAWAGSIDHTLREMRVEQKEHGETLAVLVEAKRVNDESRAERRKLLFGVIASMVGSLVALVSTVWHLFVQQPPSR